MDKDEQAPYELFYWPTLPGRGEFIRLAFEDAGVSYLDVARDPDRGGIRAIRAVLEPDDAGRPEVSAPAESKIVPLAVPVLRHGALVISQVACILDYLGPRLGLIPSGDQGVGPHARQLALSLQLTIADVVAEVHDTHHPLSTTLAYEDQTEAAKQRAELFVRHRLPKFLRYFERVAAGNAAAGRVPSLLGAHSYVDLSLEHLTRGLSHAFPTATQALLRELPMISAIRDRVGNRPNIVAYRASARCIPWTLHGIFRAYPELDFSLHA